MMNSSFFIYSIAFLIAVTASLMGLITPSVEGLDSSHNIMDGFYFYDLFGTDIFKFEHPKDIIQYTLDYHEQYPALGFIYWLPFWPFFESIVFMIAGPSLFSAQLAVFFFTCIFSVSFVAVATRIVQPALALTGLVALFATSELWVSANTIMRDMPALGMMMLTFWSFIKWQESNFTNKWLAATVCIAAISVYTKQTTAVVPISLFITLVIVDPKRLTTKSSIIGAISFITLIAPAIAFTLTLGSQNLGQSFGNSTSAIMEDYQGISRLSLENWTYYLAWLKQTAPFVSFIGLAGIAIGLVSLKKQQARAPFVIAGSLIWVVVFYLFFSYFDNKAFRFGTLFLPPIMLFALLALSKITHQFLPTSDKGASLCAAALIVLLSIPSGLRSYSEGIPRMGAIDNAMSQMLMVAKHNPGSKCITYVGDFKQVFTQALRRLDSDRHYSLVPTDTTQVTDSKRCDTIVIEASALKTQRAQIEVALVDQGYFLTDSYFKSPKLIRELLIFHKANSTLNQMN